MVAMVDSEAVAEVHMVVVAAAVILVEELVIGGAAEILEEEEVDHIILVLINLILQVLGKSMVKLLLRIS
jgi:hypothetical protein